jgi:hypothetical protein
MGVLMPITRGLVRWPAVLGSPRWPILPGGRMRTSTMAAWT